MGPSLDFTFRFDEAYVISCRVGQFETGEKLISYVRITPNPGTPLALGEQFQVPEVPPEVVAKVGRKRAYGAQIEMSGAFAVGEGKYAVELLLIDRQGRTYRKHWHVEAKQRHKDESVPLALPANTASALISKPWDGQLTENGVTLTVLLHATPMNPRAAKLYAWDRAFLLQSLNSLLREVPCRSVRVIAFNVGQRREIFHQDRFDSDGFVELMDALRHTEMATVSAKALQQEGWAGMLARLAREQIASKDASDAVVFLGPNMQLWNKVPREMIRGLEPGPHRFFYFEYYPWTGYEFHDAIDSLTEELHGTVFRIHTAAQLSQAIQKMLGQIKPPEKDGHRECLRWQ